MDLKLVDQFLMDHKNEYINKPTGRTDDNGRPEVGVAQLFDVIGDLLSADLKDDEESFKQKTIRIELAKKFYLSENGEVTVTGEDIAEIERRASKLTSGILCFAIDKAMSS